MCFAHSIRDRPQIDLSNSILIAKVITCYCWRTSQARKWMGPTGLHRLYPPTIYQGNPSIFPEGHLSQLVSMPLQPRALRLARRALTCPPQGARASCPCTGRPGLATRRLAATPPLRCGFMLHKVHACWLSMGRQAISNILLWLGGNAVALRDTIHPKHDRRDRTK